MQCIKSGFQGQGEDEDKKYNKVDFFNGLKYVVAMISTILSYLMKNYGNPVLPAWVIFAAITSAYTYYWDLKYDWLLLDKNS